MVALLSISQEHYTKKEIQSTLPMEWNPIELQLRIESIYGTFHSSYVHLVEPLKQLIRVFLQNCKDIKSSCSKLLLAQKV